MSLFKVIDEYTLLDRFLKNKSLINGETYNILKVYSKHLHSNRKNKDYIRNELDRVMEKYYTSYVRADWVGTLDTIVNRFTKKENSDFKKINEVVITNKELEFIKAVDDLEIEKVMFMMLVVSKAYGDSGMVYTDIKEIFKSAKYKYKQKTSTRDIQRANLINDLYKREIISINEKKCTNTGIKLNYILNGDINLKILINENNECGLVYYYLKWRGAAKVKECKVCGCLFELKVVNSNAKYCTACAKKIKIKTTVENRKLKT